MVARRTQLSVLEEINSQVSGALGSSSRKTIDVLESINSGIHNLVGSGGGGSAPTPATITYKAPGTGSVSRTLQTKLDDSFISVKDFGAKGDGVTDDTLAIQKAITAAAVVLYMDYYGPTVGTVYFPAGNYRHTGIDLPARVKLVGSGKGSTSLTIKGSTNRSSILVLPTPVGDPMPYADWDHATIRDMTIYGNNSSNTTGHGIEFSDPGYSLSTRYGMAAVVTDVNIIAAAECGMKGFDNRNWGLLTRVVIRSSRLEGLHIRGYDWRITDCDFGANGGDGVVFGAGGAHQLSGCNIYSNDGRGALAYGTNWIMFTNCTISSNNTHGVEISQDTNLPISFVNCRMHNNSRAASGVNSSIKINGIRPVHVTNCHFIGTASAKVKYVIEHVSTTPAPVYISGLHIPVFNATDKPYSVNPFSNPEAILGTVTEETAAGDGQNVRVGAYGTGAGELRSRNLPVVRWQGVASGVNYTVFQNATTTTSPRMTATGTDANIGFDLYTKGLGITRIRSNTGLAFAVDASGAGVNYVQVNGGLTGAAAIITSAGEANVDLKINAKGTGIVQIDKLKIPGPYANDVAAATAGVPVGCAYRATDNHLMVRAA